MTIFAYKIEQLPFGITVEKANIRLGNDFENAVAVIVDKAARAVANELTRLSGEGTEVTGEHIDHLVEDIKKQYALKSLREILKSAGYDIKE
jgi:hypothetical protein